MLKSLTLKNFRGFSDHRVEFGKESILIGKNNAGKTTVVEALRVLSVCQAKASNASFIPAPSWLEANCEGAGFRTSLDRIDFDFTNVQHAYDVSEPAVVSAKLSNNNEVRVYIGKGADEVFCQLRRGTKNIIYQRSEVKLGLFGNTRVMPPVGSLLPREKSIAKDRLNKYLDGYLAYRHFRNQLWERVSDYRLFRSLIESTWQNLQIQHFENDHGPERNEFSLLIREGKFSSEISWHGHGLQAWAQTIWFLSRVQKDATIVLDEPDVYLHADLQRKLIKVIESLGFRQTFVATHSSEIISDVPFSNVVVVQKRDRISRPAVRASEIQSSLRGMGSIHSIQLSKIASKGIMLFVEGDDRSFLLDVAFKMGAKTFDNFSEIAIHEIKGKGNWQQALGAARALLAASDGDVQAALVLDQDYMLDEQRSDYLDKAKCAGLWLHLWRRKEIENYFLVAPAIARYVAANIAGEITCHEAEIFKILDAIELDMKQDVILSYADVINKSDRGLDAKASFRKAERLIEGKIDDGLRLLDLLPGKEVFSRLSRALQQSYGVSFNALAICKECFVTEVPDELKSLITELSGKARAPAKWTSRDAA